MLTFIKQNVWLTLITVLIIGGLLYYTLANRTPSANTLLTSTGSATSPASEQLLTSLTSLSTVTLDNSIFSDPVFVSLNDYGVVIPPESAGRDNPFAPFVGAPQVQTTSKSPNVLLRP